MVIFDVSSTKLGDNCVSSFVFKPSQLLRFCIAVKGAWQYVSQSLLHIGVDRSRPWLPGMH